MSNCTRPAFRHNKPGWYGFHRRHVNKMIKECARVIVLGDSIVEGLGRYPDVWDLLKPFNTVNCGIGGDSIQNLLWRVDHLSLPVSLRVAVLLCGTNNMQHDEPKDIAEGVIACGSKLVEKDPQLHVVITGILPRYQFPSERRNRIQQTNYMLKSKCWTKGFKYIEPSSQWVSATGELESGLYFKDHLHLIRPGNNILAMQMASIVSVALSESPKIRTPLQHNHDVVTVQALPRLEIIPCTYKHQPPVSPRVQGQLQQGGLHQLVPAYN